VVGAAGKTTPTKNKRQATIKNTNGTNRISGKLTKWDHE